MQSYELACIFKPDIDAGSVKSKVDGWMSEMSATVVGMDDWGLRRLAYPVRKAREGYYVFVRFSAEPSRIPPMKRQLGLDPMVLRFLFLKEEALKPPKVTVKKRRPPSEAPTGRSGPSAPRGRTRTEASEER